MAAETRLSSDTCDRRMSKVVVFARGDAEPHVPNTFNDLGLPDIGRKMQPRNWRGLAEDCSHSQRLTLVDMSGDLGMFLIDECVCAY